MYSVSYKCEWHEVIEPIVIDFDILSNWHRNKPNTKIKIRNAEGKVKEVAVIEAIDYSIWRNIYGCIRRGSID